MQPIHHISRSKPGHVTGYFEYRLVSVSYAGMDVPMLHYDGATALAEAACGYTNQQKEKAVINSLVHRIS